MPRALLTWIWHILAFILADPVKRCPVGSGPSVDSIVGSPQRSFLKVKALAETLNVDLAVKKGHFLLEGEPTGQSVILRAVDQVSLKYISVLCHCHLNPDQSPYPQTSFPMPRPVSITHSDNIPTLPNWIGQVRRCDCFSQISY